MRTEAQIKAQKRYYEKIMNDPEKKKILYEKMKQYNKNYNNKIKLENTELYNIKKEKAREYSKKYYYNNLERIREKNKQYYYIKNQTVSSE